MGRLISLTSNSETKNFLISCISHIDSNIVVCYCTYIFNFNFSALDKIVKTGYKALQLEYFFTCGKDEVKAWTIQVCILLAIFTII